MQLLYSRNISTFVLISSLIVSFTRSFTLSAIRVPTTKTITTSSSHHLNMKFPLDKLTTFANSYAAANGIQVEKKEKSASSDDDNNNHHHATSSYVGAPISLLPNAFPAKAFQNAQTLAPHFNILVDRISRDGDFLVKTLGGEHGVISKDLYTKKLLELYVKLYMTNHEKDDKPNFAKDADYLGIMRSDYMLSPVSVKEGGDRYDIFQVELNTIASSFAGLACKIATLHQMMTERFDVELKEWLEANKKAVMGENYTPDASITEGVPENLASTKLTNAMNVAHERYIDRFKPKHPVAILFVVQEGETNTVDQRILEFNLWTNHKVPVIRMSLTKAKSLMQMDSETGALYILPDISADGENGSIPTKYEISVAYFRAGYAPTDYPDGYDGIEWDSRERIERSRATKCPSLGYHLAGTKKVQQELARSGTLERFFTDQEISDGIVTSMRAAFAGLYSLGNDTLQEDLDAVKDAITGNDSNYVLKPQREGGGYNYYGEQLAEKLKANVDDSGDALKLGDDLAEFILMQRLFPPKQTAVLLRAGNVEGTNESISELGCFGTIVQSHDGETLHNEYSGFLLRTKFSNVNEGGVASGFATLSSPYLC